MIANRFDARDAVLEGRTWVGFVRRAGPAMTASRWADLSYSAGIPVANYYASAPLVGATLAARDGIDIGPAPATGLTKYIKGVTLIPPTATGRLTFWLHDICLYYPFVDGDGGYQDMIQSAPVTRYNGGVGCRIMVVSQGVGTSAVGVRVTYTNSDGVAGRQVTATLSLDAAAGTLCSSAPVAVATSLPCGPYLPWFGDDKGVRSIESVEPLTPGGGIQAFVICHPLGAPFGMHEGTAAPLEIDFTAEQSMALPDISADSYIHFIAMGTTTASPSPLTGYVETVWG